jgi:predicted phage tail protein
METFLGVMGFLTICTLLWLAYRRIFLGATDWQSSLIIGLFFSVLLSIGVSLIVEIIEVIQKLCK